MRTVFLGILATLIIFSQIMVYKLQKQGEEGVPVIYWVTDPNPARQEQIALFREWLKKNKYPDIDVKLDTANRGMQKTIVQGVTGVAGDMIDASGNVIPVLQAIGMLEDLSGYFREFGLPVYGSHEANRHELVIDGKTYGTPCNTWPSCYIVNLDAFDRYGAPPPPERWSFEEFERRGKEFVAKGNAGRKHREVFYAYRVDGTVLRRSLGMGSFNETLTGPWPDTNAVAALHRLIYKWTFVDHIIPSDAELSSLATEQGYGGADYQLLHKGYFGMIWGGRHALIQLRKMDPRLKLTGVEMPNAGYPNTVTGSRSLVMYAGSHKKQWAKYFFAFLRSEEYSMHVVKDADSMPPLPSMLERKEFLEPADWPNEWPLQKAYARATRDLAIGFEISPFLPPTISSLKLKAFSAFMSGVGTAEDAARLSWEGVNEEMAKYVSRNPARKQAFQAARELQVKIDGLKARGEKIPAEWIANNFLRKYYLDTGKARP
jgi:ABC-type glycerol-3-phosphate transport system substrate-binding protein